MNDIINSFLTKLSEVNPPQAKYVKSSLKMLDNSETTQLSEYISFYGNGFGGIAGVNACYDFICKEMLREEILFKRAQNEKYSLSSQEEAKEFVYSNDEYMKNYMIGLGISTFLWENHLKISRYFKENLPKDKCGNYLEIGVGHGQNFSEAIKLCKFDKYIGYDISEFSLKLTDATVKFMNPGYENYELILDDFTTASEGGKYDAIVCGEVLEHVENPQNLMKKIHNLAATDAFIYITTAVNSPALDHVHLFKSAEEVVVLFNECGFEVKSKLVLPYAGVSLEEAVKEKLTLNVAFVLNIKTI